MRRRFLIIGLGLTLAACASVQEHLAFWRHKPSAVVTVAAVTTATPRSPKAPRPADGLWAILDPGCHKPQRADLRVWPKCASPFWINRDTAVVVRSRPGPHGRTPDQSYRTDFRLAAGEPLIAQVGNARDGYLFLALTELARDDQGRLIEATGAAFGCGGSAKGAVTLAPTHNGCESQSPEAIRRVAWQSLQDVDALAKVTWIAPGAP